MHPAIFVGLFVLLGTLFALQGWISMRLWSYPVSLSLLLRAWVVQYLLWGVLCWLMWRGLGPQIQQAGWGWIVTRLIPLSLLVSVTEEMIWVGFFPDLPLNRPHMEYWPRLAMEMYDDLLENMVICWCTFGLFRGIGYYQRFREKEDAAAKLEVELANAQISALRMQLNPHFLFNTMNSVSSLMQIDVAAADTMLEQLGSLLRISLKRGDAQLILLRDEIEFIELYLAMQDQRFGNRIRQSLNIDPELHDALVPAMILQPIVENAYGHGLSKIEGPGVLEIDAVREGDYVRLSVANSGVGLRTSRHEGSGLGLSNVKARLLLHYGADYTFSMREVEPLKVLVTLTLPLQLSLQPEEEEQITRFGA